MFEDLEMQNWNIPIDRAQILDEKNGLIYLNIMFIPGVMVINVFYWWYQKISHSWGKILKCIWKILTSSFRKCFGLLDSELLLARC